MSGEIPREDQSRVQGERAANNAASQGKTLNEFLFPTMLLVGIFSSRVSFAGFLPLCVSYWMYRSNPLFQRLCDEKTGALIAKITP